MNNTLNINLSKLFLQPYRRDALDMRTYQFYGGGRSTGKTTRHATRVSLDCIMIPKTIWFVVAKESSKLQTGIYNEYKKVIERISEGKFKDGREYKAKTSNYSIVFNNGSEIWFYGSKKAEELKGRSLPSSEYRFGGVHFDEFADYDEKYGIPLVKSLVPTLTRDDHVGDDMYYHYYWQGDKYYDLDLSYPMEDECGNLITSVIDGKEIVEMHQGIHTLGAKFLFSFNPPKNKYHWVFDFINEYKDRADCLYDIVNYNDMEAELVRIGQSNVITEANRAKEINFRDYQHTWLGIPTGTDGLFFKNFEPGKCRISTVPSIPSDLFAVGADFGVSNATSFTCMGINPETEDRIILGMYYHSNNDLETDEYGSTRYAEELYEFVMKNRNRYNISKNVRTRVFYDPSAKAFANDVNELMKRKKHFPIKMVKAKNDRVSTLAHLQDLIVENNFKYLSNMKYRDVLEDEFSRAECHPTKDDDIIKVNDHSIDSTRYVSYGLLKKSNRRSRKYWKGE